MNLKLSNKQGFNSRNGEKKLISNLNLFNEKMNHLIKNYDFKNQNSKEQIKEFNNLDKMDNTLRNIPLSIESFNQLSIPHKNKTERKRISSNEFCIVVKELAKKIVGLKVFLNRKEKIFY